MKNFLFLFLIPLFSFGQEPLQERLKKASKDSKKPANKLEKKHQGINDNYRLNGEIFQNLLDFENVTQEYVQRSMELEIDYLNECLKQDHLSNFDRRWIQNILDIAEKLKEPFYIEEGEYVVQECSSIIGMTAYRVKVERDPNHPGQFFIHNFYNMGFDHKIAVNQSGETLNIKRKTFEGFDVASQTQFSNKEAEAQNKKDNAHRDKIPPITSCLEGNSNVYKHGNFNLATTVNDGSATDYCYTTFTRVSEPVFNIKPYNPSSP